MTKLNKEMQIRANELQEKYRRREGYLGVYRYGYAAVYAFILDENDNVLVYSMNYAVTAILRSDVRGWIVRRSMVRIL